PELVCKRCPFRPWADASLSRRGEASVRVRPMALSRPSCRSSDGEQVLFARGLQLLRVHVDLGNSRASSGLRANTGGEHWRPSDGGGSTCAPPAPPQARRVTESGTVLPALPARTGEENCAALIALTDWQGDDAMR